MKLEQNPLMPLPLRFHPSLLSRFRELLIVEVTKKGGKCCNRFFVSHELRVMLLLIIAGIGQNEQIGNRRNHNPQYTICMWDQ